MQESKIKNEILIILVIFFSFFAVNLTFAHPGHDNLPESDIDGYQEMGGSHLDSDVEELQKLIEERTQEIEEIEAERARLEEELGEVSATADALTREINSLDHQINDIDLSIRSNELVLERLELELSTLNNEVKITEENIEKTKNTIARLLVRMQQRQNDSLLAIILKNQNLSEGVAEIQSIMSLNQALTGNINEFQELRKELDNKIAEIEQNHRQREIEQSTLSHRQSSAEELRQDRAVLLSQTESEAREYEQRIAELEAQQQELYSVIAEMEESLRLAFDPTLLPSEIPGVIGWPLSATCMTQAYGETAFARVTYGSGYHNGIDFRARVPTSVLAVEGGTVKAVDNNDRSAWQKYQYGKYVLIEHNNNLTSIYAHLSGQTVQTGQTVNRGDLIGYTGNTGFSMAPHLHFGLYWSPSVELRSIPPAAGLVPVGVDVDPTGYLPSGSNRVSC